ncbi:leucyl/phenylalanyl-tRNA--protein transferase [Methylomonas sp. AM2-LC]|uniref:leucyl/phenylalanyl-tRNA--protein transferase n=1 Tax=Methylomonas sp. AM2-LC TaxID=3153301 RepID=UPI00326496D0
MSLIELDANNPQQVFPTPAQALAEPNGLLAYGGCLSEIRLINAYQLGIFPWYNPDEPILWWSPNPRLVLFPDRLKLSRSLQKTLRQKPFQIKYDTAFEKVMHGCAAPREGSSGTWINPEILNAYQKLHASGVAHSFEAWQQDELVGGLYGVAIGQVFFGESMFHTKTDASKVVFAHMVEQLTAWGYRLIDCQVTNKHLLSLGAEEIPRSQFQDFLSEWCNATPSASAWQR